MLSSLKHMLFFNHRELPVLLSSKDLLALVFLSKCTGEGILRSVLSLSGLMAGSLSILRDFARGSGVGFWFLT